MRSKPLFFFFAVSVVALAGGCEKEFIGTEKYLAVVIETESRQIFPSGDYLLIRESNGISWNSTISVEGDDALYLQYEIPEDSLDEEYESVTSASGLDLQLVYDNNVLYESNTNDEDVDEISCGDEDCQVIIYVSIPDFN